MVHPNSHFPFSWNWTSLFTFSWHQISDLFHFFLRSDFTIEVRSHDWSPISDWGDVRSQKRWGRKRRNEPAKIRMEWGPTSLARGWFQGQSPSACYAPRHSMGLRHPVYISASPKTKKPCFSYIKHHAKQNTCIIQNHINGDPSPGKVANLIWIRFAAEALRFAI